MALIITPKNKHQEKIVAAFLTSLSIGFHSEKDEDAALLNAMRAGKKTSLLSTTEKNDFLKRLKKQK